MATTTDCQSKTEATIRRALGVSVPEHDARDIVGPDARAIILLDGVRYQLRITRQNKLILTK